MSAGRWGVAAAAVLTTTTLIAPAHAGFGGAWLQSPRVGVTFNGTAYPRLFCAGGTDGFCQGTVTILRRGRVLGTAPLAIRSGDGPSVEVPLRGGRRDAILAGGRAVTVTVRVHDGAEPVNWRTTTRPGALANG